MNRHFRRLLFIICASQAILTIGLLLQTPFLTDLWPLPDTTPISFIFIASIFAASLASTLWCLLAQEDGALAGIGLDYIAIFIPMSIFGFQLVTENSAMFIFSILCLIFAVFGLVIFLQSQHIPIRDTRPMPKMVRISFMIFIPTLILVGSLLILKTPNILPWRVTPEFGVLSGWFFFGAAIYFIYGLLRPSWHNATGQLAGFLAYDVVLIIPFLQRLSTIADELRLSLIVYLIVIIYSGLLAIYYLFINTETNIWHSFGKTSTS